MSREWQTRLGVLVVIAVLIIAGLNQNLRTSGPATVGSTASSSPSTSTDRLTLVELALLETVDSMAPQVSSALGDLSVIRYAEDACRLMKEYRATGQTLDDYIRDAVQALGEDAEGWLVISGAATGTICPELLAWGRPAVGEEA